MHITEQKICFKVKKKKKNLNLKANNFLKGIIKTLENTRPKIMNHVTPDDTLSLKKKKKP